MIGSEYGNGTKNDMARLITRDIPIHINCCDRKSLLLLNWIVCNVMFIKCYLFQKIRDLQGVGMNYVFNSVKMRIST